MKFIELSSERKKRIREYGLAYFTLKGVENPKESLEKFLNKKDKKNKSWRNQVYGFMIGIDTHRKKIG